MFKALTIHIWLLMTLRHDGRGLPSKHWPTFLFLIGLSTIVATLKNNWAIGLSHGAILLFLATFFPSRFIAGWALMSVGIDLLRMTLETTLGIPGGHGLWQAYELSAMAVFFFKMRAYARSLK